MLPYSYFIDNIGHIRVHSDDGGISWPSLIASLFFTSLEIFFIYRIVTRFLIVSLNIPEQIITFYYPLKFIKQGFDFNQIHSIQFSNFQSKICNFKCLLFKTRSNKIYQITDFEIWNFRSIENVALDSFELSKGKSEEILEGEAKVMELSRNKRFDVEQAGEYRFFCYLNLVLVVIFYFIDKYLAIPSRKFGWVAWGLCLLLAIFSIAKIVQANRTIKGNAFLEDQSKSAD